MGVVLLSWACERGRAGVCCDEIKVLNECEGLVGYADVNGGLCGNVLIPLYAEEVLLERLGDWWHEGYGNGKRGEMKIGDEVNKRSKLIG